MVATDGIGLSSRLLPTSFLIGLMNQRIGSSDDQWVKLAQGNKISMPPVKDDKRAELLAQLDSPPAPRHTITLTVRSTLPPVG